MPAEYEELQLKVSLVDEATPQLLRLRTELKGVGAVLPRAASSGTVRIRPLVARRGAFVHVHYAAQQGACSIL